jgi:hypothetical protein
LCLVACAVLFCVLRLIAVPMPPGTNSLAVKINNNNNNNNNSKTSSTSDRSSSSSSSSNSNNSVSSTTQLLVTFYVGSH